MTLIESLEKCWTGEVTLGPIAWRAILANMFVASALVGGFVVVVEPDHTAELSFLTAFGLWFLHILFILAIFVGSLRLLRHAGFPDLLATGAAGLTSPAIFAPVSLLLDVGFGKPDEELTTSAHLLSVYLVEVSDVAPVTWAAALTMSFALYRQALLRHPAPDASGVVNAPAKPALKELIESVPSSLGNDIVRMQSQDHYVEVVTLEGRALITERFGDCVRRLDQMNGIQCHRSHWISLCHAESLSRAGSAYLCTMDNGDQVPVSRRRYSELKQRLNDVGSFRSD